MAQEDSGGPSNGVHEEESAEMSVYKKDACKVVTFRLVYNKEDLESEKGITFKPDMAHQIFGESESIFGYRNVSVYLNYLHNSCRCFVDINTSGELQNDTMKPDDIGQIMDQWLPGNYTRNADQFIQWIRDEEPGKMFGEVIKSIEQDPEVKYHITKSDTEDEEFTDFHSRFETFIVWFIDAANFIDLEDEKWIIFYVYEERGVNKTPIGFCTVYKFYAYPSNIRARISQFFVLPSHQRRGVGTMLYETVSQYLRSMGEVIDITVEEPTSAFQKIRDLEDCGALHKNLVENKLNFFATSSKKIFELGRANKIGKRQMQRVYDILSLFYVTEKGTEACKKALDHILQRIADENERESRPSSKRLRNVQGAPQSIEVDRKAQVEQEFKRHCEDIEPSVKYLQEKLEGWLKIH